MRFAAALVALPGLTVTGEARDLQRPREGEPQVEIIGFSRDGGAFAFVEYGFADWAGPYARLSIVDALTGEALGGGPFSAGLPRDGAGLPDGSLPATEADFDEVLADAMRLADQALREAGLLGGDPLDAGHVLVFNPPTEMQQTARFVTRRGYAFAMTPLTLAIADVPLRPPDRCAFGIEGFAGVEILLADDTGAELFRSRYRPSNMTRFWSEPPLRYAVFAAGLPRDAIEAQLTRTLRFFIGVLPEDIPPIVEAYRLLAGPP